MNINKMFPSEYLRAADIEGRDRTVLVMNHCTLEKVGDKERPILTFTNTSLKLVLNRTNAEMIAKIYGEETNLWQGKPIELYTIKTQYMNQVVDAIRVKPPQQRQPQSEQSVYPPQTTQGSAQAPSNGRPHTGPHNGFIVPDEDDIPY